MSGKDLDKILDRALDEIRDSKLDPQAESAIAASVWQRVSEELPSEESAAGPQLIRSCADFQQLIPAFARGELANAKQLLVQDHVNECVTCRRTLKQQRAGQTARPVTAGPRRRSPVSTWGWRIAAAAAIVVALIGLDFETDLFVIKTRGMITIENISGEAYGVRGDGTTLPLSEGQQIDFSDVTGIRTAKDSNLMLRLEDESRVEMNERAELAVSNKRKFYSAGRPDGVIELERGSIIVEASEQGANHLFVNTDDADVAVTGTVFAVNHGVKGSRVSVIEGEVEVASKRGNSTLQPGDQAVTTADLVRVPIEDEIAWSENLERHVALLAEWSKVAREIDDALEMPGLRYDATLLDLAPADTVLYIGIPNVSGTVADAYDMLQDKVADNELLSQWWNDEVAASGADSELQRVMDKVRSYGEHIGDEIVFTLPMEFDGDVKGPVVMAKLTRPQAFGEFIAGELEELAAQEGNPPDIRLLETGGVDTQTGLPADGSADLYLWTYEDNLVVTSELERLTQFLTATQAGRSGFADGTFHGRIAELYEEGVDWVFGVDLETIFAANAGDDPRESEQLEAMGLMDLQHVIAEIKQKGDRTENRVSLTFDQPRKGLASWLAEPAPMGALDFISPEATIAAGFVMREPREVVDELFGWISSDDSNFEQELDQFESEHGIDIRDDIAGALGGEFAFALDGPVLPVPSWKLIVEVYDPAGLQQTLEWAVEQINQVALDNGSKGLRMIEHEMSGRTFYELESVDIGLSAHYTFSDGYMVASASRALLNRTLQNRDNGITLTGSGRFTSLLPSDAQVNFSAVVYQNMAALLGPLARLGEAAGNASPELQQMLGQVGQATGPSLTLAYGETERISFVSTSEGGWLTSSLGSFLRWDSLLSMQELLEQATEEGTQSHSSSYRIEG